MVAKLLDFSECSQQLNMAEFCHRLPGLTLVLQWFKDKKVFEDRQVGYVVYLAWRCLKPDKRWKVPEVRKAFPEVVKMGGGRYNVSNLTIYYMVTEGEELLYTAFEMKRIHPNGGVEFPKNNVVSFRGGSVTVQ